MQDDQVILQYIYKNSSNSSNLFSSCCASISCNFINNHCAGQESRPVEQDWIQLGFAVVESKPTSSQYKTSRVRHRTTKESSVSRLFSATFEENCINQKTFSGAVSRRQLCGWWEALRQHERKMGEFLCFCFQTGFDARQTLCEISVSIPGILSAGIRLPLAFGDFI